MIVYNLSCVLELFDLMMEFTGRSRLDLPVLVIKGVDQVIRSRWYSPDRSAMVSSPSVRCTFTVPVESFD